MQTLTTSAFLVECQTEHAPSPFPGPVYQTVPQLGPKHPSAWTREQEAEHRRAHRDEADAEPQMHNEVSRQSQNDHQEADAGDSNASGGGNATVRFHLSALPREATRLPA